MGWANNESTINWAWSCERSIDVLMNLWVKAVLAWLGWIGLFVGLWPLAGNKPTKKTSKPREACELICEWLSWRKREGMNETKSRNEMSWWSGVQPQPLSSGSEERRPKGPNAPRQAKEANKTILHFLAVAGKAKEMKSCVCWCGDCFFSYWRNANQRNWKRNEFLFLRSNGAVAFFFSSPCSLALLRHNLSFL